MKKSLIYILIAAAIVVGVVYYLKSDKPEAIETINHVHESGPVEITINYDGSANFKPQTTRVQQGQKVVIKVTTGLSDEAHLHGYNYYFDLEAGKQTTFSFVADTTGRFDLELHESGKHIGVIEVYPK